MPRYFFHVHSAQGTTRDKVGQDIPDVETAKATAVKALHDMRGLKAERVAAESLLIEIADGDGNTVANVPLPAGSRFPSANEPDDEGNDLA